MMNDILDTETVQAAQKIKLQDKDGSTVTFGDLTAGKKVVVIFIRHFWCGLCATYVTKLSEELPPSRLPKGVSVIIIGSGSYTPIPEYLSSTRSQYPLYANPTKSLYKMFDFSSNLARNTEAPKTYMADQGILANLWFSLKRGPMRNPTHFKHVGEISQNGGEMLLETDGTCTYFHRMLRTDDHTDIADLVKVVRAS